MTKAVENEQQNSRLVNLSGLGYKSAQALPISSDLQLALLKMVRNLVDALQCVGAVVTTLEADNSLILRAYSINVTSDFANNFSKQFDVNLLGPKLILNLNENRFKDNLAVQASIDDNPLQPDQYLLSDRLYDIVRPLMSEPLADSAQHATGLQQVIVVPFLIEDEHVGHIIAASAEQFSLEQISLLTGFGHQAASAIHTQRTLTEIQALERVILSLQTSIMDETQTLQIIVDAMVETLGYAGAIVATLEAGNALPVRTYRIDIMPQMLKSIEAQAGISLKSDKSVVYLDDPKFKDNLSYRAVKGRDGKPEKHVVSHQLHALFTPFIPRAISEMAQKLIRIKQVIAVPFYLEEEVVGNIFVATRKPRFTNREMNLLATFGQQAAVGIRNARLYKKAEERRQIAQIFGKMAFSATANIHALRNHIGAFQAYIRLNELTSSMEPEQRAEILQTTPSITDHLYQAADILDNLHEPWRQTSDVPTSVNRCLNWATRKAFSTIALDFDRSEIETDEGITIHRAFANDLPFLQTSPDMLTEAFHVLIGNAVEALTTHKHGSHLWLKTQLVAENLVEIEIKDDGIGIEQATLGRIFELGWSTKKSQGMGFGLFWTKDYIEGLGGTIKAESKYSVGTTFTVRLPVKQT